MNQGSTQNGCRHCLAPRQQLETMGNITICNNCQKVNYEPQWYENRWVRGSALMIATLLISYFAWPIVRDQITGLDGKFKRMTSEQQIIKAIRECELARDKECSLAGHKRLVELDPADVSYKANYAFRLTDLKRYQEAQQFYDELASDGHGTYDLMAYHAENLKGLNRLEDAKKFYEMSLATAPNMYDVTKDFALLLVKLKEPVAAVSVLKAFVEHYPNSRGRLEGNIRTILSQLNTQSVDGKSAEKQKVSLYSQSGGHHYINAGSQSGNELFMVDTGATQVAMSTETFKRHFARAAKNLRTEKARLADGRIINAQSFEIPEFKIGPWVIKNVTASHCANCSLLLGRSVLKHFRTRTEPRGSLEVMEIERAM